jgi:acyl dehydratase
MNLAHVVARRFAPVEQAWDERDSALYGVSLGMGSDPLDEDELPYVFEGRGLRAVPSLALTLGWPAFWQDDPATGIDWMRILHGEQHLRLHRALPAQGRVRATHRLRAVEDKGAGKGALIHFDIDLHDAATGDALASLRQVQFLRGDGGCGAWGEAPAPCAAMPADWQPAQHIDYRTGTQAALLYRLASRDMMPLHADPQVARHAGFDRPISHGLNNLGLACRALLKHLLPGQPERLRALSVRFAQPSFPGETIRVGWRVDDSRDGGLLRVRFRAHALERQVLLMDRGEAEILAA